MNDQDIRALIVREIGKYKSVLRTSIAMGVASNHLSGIKNGNRPISKKVLDYFGIERATVYRIRERA